MNAVSEIICTRQSLYFVGTLTQARVTRIDITPEIKYDLRNERESSHNYRKFSQPRYLQHQSYRYSPTSICRASRGKTKFRGK